MFDIELYKKSLEDHARQEAEQIAQYDKLYRVKPEPLSVSPYAVSLNADGTAIISGSGGGSGLTLHQMAQALNAVSSGTEVSESNDLEKIRSMPHLDIPLEGPTGWRERFRKFDRKPWEK